MGMTPEEREGLRDRYQNRRKPGEQREAGVALHLLDDLDAAEAKASEYAERVYAMQKMRDAAEARIAELEAERDRQATLIESLNESYQERLEERDHAQERNERLMEALRLAVIHVEGPGALARIDAILYEVEGEK